MLMKARLAGAQKGHGLLKKKADALQMRFRQILGKIIETKTLMGEVMKEAAFSLAEAKFATGDFNQVVLQNVTKAQIKIRTKKDNVAGVTLPVFESYTVSIRTSPLVIGRAQLLIICSLSHIIHRTVRIHTNWLVWLVVANNCPN